MDYIVACNPRDRVVEIIKIIAITLVFPTPNVEEEIILTSVKT